MQVFVSCQAELSHGFSHLIIDIESLHRYSISTNRQREFHIKPVNDDCRKIPDPQFIQIPFHRFFRPSIPLVFSTHTLKSKTISLNQNAQNPRNRSKRLCRRAHNQRAHRPRSHRHGFRPLSQQRLPNPRHAPRMGISSLLRNGI